MRTGPICSVRTGAAMTVARTFPASAPHANQAISVRSMDAATTLLQPARQPEPPPSAPRWQPSIQVRPGRPCRKPPRMPAQRQISGQRSDRSSIARRSLVRSDLRTVSRALNSSRDARSAVSGPGLATTAVGVVFKARADKSDVRLARTERNGTVCRSSRDLPLPDRLPPYRRRPHCAV